MSFEHNQMAAAFVLSCVFLANCGARMKKTDCGFPGCSIESCTEIVCLKCAGVVDKKPEAFLDKNIGRIT